MNPFYAEVARRAGHRCEYCHAPEALFNLPFEVEHVVPTSQMGITEQSNLCLACRSCNLFKSNHTEAVDPTTGATVPLYNPREHRWAEHFAIDLERAEIHGLTPVGRATVELLRQNDPAQLGARQYWIALRLFP